MVAMQRLKIIQIPLDNKTYRTVKKAKGKKTWPEFLMSKCNIEWYKDKERL